MQSATYVNVLPLILAHMGVSPHAGHPARPHGAELREYGATAGAEAGPATATGRDDAMTPLPEGGAHDATRPWIAAAPPCWTGYAGELYWLYRKYRFQGEQSPRVCEPRAALDADDPSEGAVSHLSHRDLGHGVTVAPYRKALI